MKRPGSILQNVIFCPRIRFLEPDAGGGSGGEGGGGDPGGGGGDANTAVLDFRAPDVNIAADFMLDKPGIDLEKATAPAKPAKPVTKKPEVTPPAPKPGEKPPQNGEPPVKQLRDELETLKKERDELKAYREQGDPKVKEVEAKLKEKETEIAEAKTSIADYERKLALADPAVTAKLRDNDQLYDRDAAKFYTSVPEIDNRTVNQLVLEFNALPFGKPEYRQARAEFEAKVNTALGGTDDQEHRKLERALNFIERSHEYAVERPKIVQEVQNSALKLKREASLGAYTKQSDFVKAAIAKAGEIPEGIEQTDPYHPKLMIKTFMDHIPEEHKASFSKDIPEFISRVLAGPAPRSEQDYAGMTPQQVKESQASEAEQTEKDRAIAADVMFNGLRALRLFPILVKEWKRLREKLKEDVDGNPPDPTGGGDPNVNADDDIRNFKAPRISDINI